MRLVLEADVGFDQAAAAFDIDVVEAVDHDVADGGIFEELFERAQAEDFVEDLFGDAVAFRDGHGDAFVCTRRSITLRDLAADALFVESLELVRRE